jgi:hypothetical protein
MNSKDLLRLPRTATPEPEPFDPAAPWTQTARGQVEEWMACTADTTAQVLGNIILDLLDRVEATAGDLIQVAAVMGIIEKGLNG